MIQIMTETKLDLLLHKKKLSKKQTSIYSKGPKFSDARKLFCNLSYIQTKRSNLYNRVFCQNYAKGIANSEDLI